MEEKNKNTGMGAVIALAIVIVVALIVLTIAVVGLIKDSGGTVKKEDTTVYTLSGVTNETKETNESNIIDATKDDSAYLEWDEPESSYYTPSNTDASPVNTQTTTQQEEVAGDVVTTPPTTQKSEQYDPVAEYEKLTKNGENILSDHHNNRFIKLVSEKFKVDKELLVAIYSEPDTGNNFVLEFSGKRDGDGNVIKSPDTLTKVYSIDKNQNIAVATGKTTGNIGVSYAEGTLCFNMIKTIVMPQYPEYFTGVEK